MHYIFIFLWGYSALFSPTRVKNSGKTQGEIMSEAVLSALLGYTPFCKNSGTE
jgi:hypothetical protein